MGVERLNAVVQVRLQPEPAAREPKMLAALDALRVVFGGAGGVEACAS